MTKPRRPGVWSAFVSWPMILLVMGAFAARNAPDWMIGSLVMIGAALIVAVRSVEEMLEKRDQRLEWMAETLDRVRSQVGAPSLD